jgi:GntR family transcriptional regulator
MVQSVIVVDGDSAEPVYAQIARQIRAGLVSGELAAGRVLPSVRSIASDLGINFNTVARAYRILEEEGFVSIRDRAGVTVMSPSRRNDGSTLERWQEDLAVVLARMRQAGLSLGELRLRVERELASWHGRGDK